MENSAGRPDRGNSWRRFAWTWSSAWAAAGSRIPIRRTALTASAKARRASGRKRNRISEVSQFLFVALGQLGKLSRKGFQLTALRVANFAKTVDGRIPGAFN